MSRRDDTLLLIDILEALEVIQDYIQGYTYEEFIQDRKTKDAVIRNLEIVGEASNHLSDAYKNKNDQIPWRQMIGIRNRIIHEYFGVDYAIVWNIISKNLESIRIDLEKLSSE
jgi:uncharacterized protein with HEPN domain